jgi:hypothetical protein
MAAEMMPSPPTSLTFCILSDTYVTLIEIRQTEVFARWYAALRDRRARRRIQVRIACRSAIRAT